MWVRLLYWTAYAVTLAEFAATSINTLRGSKPHVRRFQEVGFPLAAAKIMAIIELASVGTLLIGFWEPRLRPFAGSALALCFLILIWWCVRARRALSDILALGLFVACALWVAFGAAW